MNIAFLMNDFKPGFCGVSDYCVSLADDFNKNGHNAVLVDVSYDFYNFKVFDIKGGRPILRDNYHGYNFFCQFDYVLVQYTPFMYSNSWLSNRFRVVRLAQRISKFNARVMVTLHEGYEFFGGSSKEFFLASIINLEILWLSIYSHFFVTSSETLLRKHKKYKFFCNIFWLPISSNFHRLKNSKSKNLPYPSVNGICIFGGANNLRHAFKHVLVLQDYLAQENIEFRWMVLGAVDVDLLDQMNEPIIYGPLSANDVSNVLSCARVFLMPNVHGVSLKRGTLMAAMQHGLPVVGTAGVMTDPLLHTIEGIKLFELDDFVSFCEAVKTILVDDVEYQELGSSNIDDYERYFSSEVRYNLLCGYLRGLG